MAVTCAVTEASGLLIQAGTPYESTQAGSFRTANSRASFASNTPSSQWRVSAPAAITDGWFKVQWWTNFVDTDDAGHFLSLLSGVSGNEMIRLNCSSNGSVMGIQYWNGATWAQLGSNWNPSIYSSVMTEIAIKFTCGVGGTAEIFFNGISKASGSIGSAIPSLKDAVMWSPDVNAQWWFSEAIFSDTNESMIGTVVETEAPTGNGADSTDGTGAYTDIDETVTTDTDKITFTAAGQRRSFTSPARTGTLSEVLGVGVAARMSRGSSGPQKAKFYLTIGGVRYYSPDITLSLGFAGYQYVWAVNPANGLAWTPTDANAATLEWGVEAVA